MKLLVYLIGLVLGVTCLGCVSYHWLLRPGVEGVVIDGKTEVADQIMVEITKLEAKAD
jgi:hypothetical protein